MRTVLSRVIDTIAQTTRYPTELLTPEANLENDLGIDSVKRLEIVVALGDEFQLDLAAQPRDPAIGTISEVAAWVETFLQAQGHASVDSLSADPVADRATGSVEIRRHDSPELTRSFPAPYLVGTPATERSPTPAMTNADSAKPLAGRVALVTGSGHGVGRTIARVLAARGATVVVNSFHSRDQGEETVHEINARGDTAVHLWGSVSNAEHVDRIFSEIEQQFGRLDILVCNASDGKIGSFLDLTPEDWLRAFSTNVSGHHQCAVRASRLMRGHGGGSIVTMSAVGSHGYIDGLGSQGVVKAAVETLTQYLACELGQYGIRANCIVGGPVYGDLLTKFPNSQATQNHWESITPGGELSSAMDLANAIAFLVSDDARGINGSIWPVDQGFSAIADGRPLRAATAPVLAPSA